MLASSVLTFASAARSGQHDGIQRMSERQSIGAKAGSLVAGFAPREILKPRAQIEAQIGSAITLGSLPVGTRLPSEAELANQFGVSRNTVREALRSLETRGLIVKKTGAQGGSFVRCISEESLSEELGRLMQRLLSLGRIAYEELAEVRLHLECPAIRLASQNRTEAQLAQMWSLVNEGDVQPANSTARTNLHGLIAEASGNALLATFILALHRQGQDLLYLPINPTMVRTNHKQHVGMVKAIERCDANAAEKALLKHLSYLKASVPAPPESPECPLT